MKIALRHAKYTKLLRSLNRLSRINKPITTRLARLLPNKKKVSAASSRLYDGQELKDISWANRLSRIFGITARKKR
jgi:hypothetical protein